MQLRHLLLASLLAGASSRVAAASLFGGDDEESGPRNGYHAFAVGVPYTHTRDSVLRLELNLQGHASISLETSLLRRGDDIEAKQRKNSGESLMTEGLGAALLLSRYSDGTKLAGFYWGLGLGIRRQTALWSVKPDGQDPELDMSLVDPQALRHHHINAQGPTAHLRIGYRYVGESFPLSLGLYVGVRHFRPSLQEGDETRRDPTAVYSPVTEREADRLRRRLSTAPEPGLEIGLVF